jgi:hypothetical protein
MSAPRNSDSLRRDRLLLLSALAVVLITVLGPAGENLGMDRLLYGLVSVMPDHPLQPQIEIEATLLSQNTCLTETFGLV